MQDFDLNNYGGAGVFHWTHEYLLNYLTTGKHKLIRQPLMKNAFRKIRRDDFVPDELKSVAFEDRDLDIGFGETLTKPTTVAAMLNLLNLPYGGRILDIGTGSGWVAALLAMLVGEEGEVISLERVQFLADIARVNLSRYEKIKNVRIVFRDGAYGMPEKAPYDAIHVSVAFASVPEVLLKQLKISGKMIIPNLDGDIRLIERTKAQEFRELTYRGFLFKQMKSGVQ